MNRLTASTLDLQQQIEQARAMSPEDKLLAGARLFDMACKVSLDGIRYENPGIDDEAALQRLRQRLRLGRELEEREVKRRLGNAT